jgi:signal transduction histidine kinase
MKVLNYTTAFFALLLLIIIPVWAGLFYYSVLDEIYDSIDDGLDNQKGLIIKKAAIDSSILLKNNFDESSYAIREIAAWQAIDFRDKYADTMMYMQNEQDFEPVRLLRTVFQQNGKYYQMEVATSMVEEDDLVATLLRALIWLYLGLVTSILLLNNFLLKRIWRPFYYLVKGLKNFSLEKANTIDVKKTNISEFALLNETIQRLLRKNIDSYNSQKQFIENASHELQTPLAITINKLEALAETNPLSSQQLKLLGSAMDNLERLTRLNKALLLISKIENRQFEPAAAVSLNAFIKNISLDFGDQVNYKQLEYNIEEHDQLVVKINEDLAIILITNLIKNAIVHSPEKGSVKIIITRTSLSIENDGQGIPLDHQNLFSRFHSIKSTEHSTGLGLSIIKSITDLYNFHLSYYYRNRHLFIIDFKKASHQ